MLSRWHVLRLTLALEMTNTPFHWKCKICEAEAASSDTEMLLTVIKSHMNYAEHYDFDFWKEIPQPAK